jgi:hypothetical protein
MTATSKRKYQMAFNRERVRHYRHRQAEMGCVRVEVYLDQEMLDAVYDSAEYYEVSINDRLKSLVLLGLRIEEKLPAPEVFWGRIRSLVERYR